MSLFGSVFGDSKDANPSDGPKDLARISERLFRQASPLRNQLIGNSKDFLNGGFDVTSLPQYGALRSAADAQFSNARNNIMANTPSGGSLVSALANLEGQRANAMVSGMGSLADQEMARTFALATGSTPVALGGLGAAANSLGNIQAAQSAQQGAALQGLGYGAGSYLGGKGASSGAASAGSKAGSSSAIGAGSSAGASSGAAAMCWVAEALYGFGYKTKTIREYALKHINDRTFFGLFVRCYSQYGRRWATWVGKYPAARLLAKMIWDAMYKRAVK